MSDSGLRGLIVAMILVGVFFFALVNFAIQFADDTGANTTLTDKEIINSSFADIETRLGIAEDETRSAKALLANETVGKEQENPISAIWTILNIIPNTVIGMYNIIADVAKVQFGISPVILGAFVSIMGVVIATLIWRAWKAGE